MNWLRGKKSYFVAGATILYALVIEGWQNGNWALAGQIIWGALGFSALRAGVAKK